LELRQLFESRVGAGGVVLVALDRTGFSARSFAGADFFSEVSRSDCLAGSLLGARRKNILVRAWNLEFAADVLTGLGHRVDAVLLLHQRIDEAPADGRVVDFCRTGESFLRLALHEGRSRHRFNAAGNGKFDLAGTDCARGGPDRIKSGGTKPV